jgi:hypothetical protein
MLHMLQVFQSHIVSVLFKMFHLFSMYVKIFFIWMLHMFYTYVATIFPNASVISILCCSKWFYIASCKSGYFMCFTHMLQVYVLNVLSIFRRILHSNVFHVVSVLCCTAEDETDWACSVPKVPMDGVLGAGGRWCCGWSAPGRARPQLASPFNFLLEE